MPADMQILVRHIRRMATRGRFAKDSDRFLIESYVHDGNQDAFATIVSRHASLVAGVCRRVLANAQDIEDVFQATFLVLARKAGTVQWHDSVANWLHGVAHRLALRSRADAIRRQALQHAACAQAVAAEPAQQTRDLQLLLDAELEGLPEPQRLPLILCYLEGRTRDEAAKQCGWSMRTLERRLEQGRNLLRDRLVRRGLDMSVVLLAAALGELSGTAQAQLISATLKFLQTTGAAGGGLSASTAARLAETALPIAGAGYLKFAVGLVLALVATGIGASALVFSSADDSSPASQADNQAAAGVEEHPTLIGKAEPVQGVEPLPKGAVRFGPERFRGSGFGKVQYSPDGKHLITAGSGGVQVFDSTTGMKLLHVGAGLHFAPGTSAISPDGKLAALADPTGAKPGIVYNVSTGRQICELQTPVNRTTRLTGFSRDGALLAALVSQVCIDLYSTSTGQLVRSVQWDEKYMPPSNSSIYWGEVGFLADGKSMAVSIHHSGVIRIFDVEHGTETRQIVVSPHGMAGMALSPDGKTLLALPCVARETRVSGFQEKPDESVQVLDAANGKQLGELLIPNVQKHWFKIGPDNKTLFATSGTNLGLWRLDTGRKVGEIPFPMIRSINQSFNVSPDGKTIAYPLDSVLHQIDFKTGKEVVALEGHKNAIHAITFGSAGSTIATGSLDGEVILWDRATAKQLHAFNNRADEPQRDPLYMRGGPVQQIILSDRLGMLYVISGTRGRGFGGNNADLIAIQAFNVLEDKEQWSETPSRFGSFSQKGRQANSNLATNSGPSDMVLNGNQLALLKPDFITLVDANSGKSIRAQHLEPQPAEKPVVGIPTALSYAKERDELVAWTRGQELWRGDWALNRMVMQPSEEAMRMTKAKNGRGLDYENAPQSVAFSPDCKLLAMGGIKPYLLLLSVETGKEVRRIARSEREKDSSVEKLVFAPDGQSLAWISADDRSVHMTGVAGNLPVRTLPTLDSGATSLAWSADGKSLAVGCADSTAIVWELEKVLGGK